MQQIDRYIDRVLEPGETIVHRGRVHWIVFANPLALTAFCGIVLGNLGSVFPPFTAIGAIGGLVGVAGLALAYLRMVTDELTITDRRVVAKFGFLSRHVVEMRLEQVEAVQISQSVVGRLLDYGSILVTGTGGSITPIPLITQPLIMRNMLAALVHRVRGMSASVGAAATDAGFAPDQSPVMSGPRVAPSIERRPVRNPQIPGGRSRAR